MGACMLEPPHVIRGNHTICNGWTHVQAVIIPEGGHHLDLFFSNDADPDSVTQARAVEVASIKQWIEEYHQQTKHW